MNIQMQTDRRASRERWNPLAIDAMWVAAAALQQLARYISSKGLKNKTFIYNISNFFCFLSKSSYNMNFSMSRVFFLLLYEKFIQAEREKKAQYSRERRGAMYEWGGHSMWAKFEQARSTGPRVFVAALHMHNPAPPLVKRARKEHPCLIFD